MLLPAVLPGARAGFTDRHGGVSTGPLASLNLALRGEETAAHLTENWDRVARALDPARGAHDVALVDQVHGAEVRVVTDPTGPLATQGRADALVTAKKGIVLAVRTADCVPVLLAGEGCIAAAHAGWRGVAAGVLEATVRVMRELGAERIHAVIGPHIGIEAYEVGDEVVHGIAATGVPHEVFVQRRVRAHVDVGAAAAWQLEQLGVRVHREPRCTFHDAGFYSHRRDGEATGRQAGVITR